MRILPFLAAIVFLVVIVFFRQTPAFPHVVLESKVGSHSTVALPPVLPHPVGTKNQIVMTPEAVGETIEPSPEEVPPAQSWPHTCGCGLDINHVQPSMP